MTDIQQIVLARRPEGDVTTASGARAHAEGYGSVASGSASHAQGWDTEASGSRSQAAGFQSKASRDFQQAYSWGQRAAKGDNQRSRVGWSTSQTGAGWHAVRLIRGLENDKTYAFEATVIGRQTGGTAGTVGDSWAYAFRGAFTVAAGALTVLGTIERTLLGRSAGLAGDGLTAGARLTAYTSVYAGTGIGDLIVKHDGVADTTFYVSAYTEFQELG